MDPTNHFEVAVATYERCWELLEQTSRTIEGDVELLTSAFDSRYHWTFVGGAVQTIWAYWMISKAAAAVSEGSLAVAFAPRTNTEVREPSIDDWFVASTAEGLARPYAAVGMLQLRDEWDAINEGLVRMIIDDEDRELIASRLSTVPR